MVQVRFNEEINIGTVEFFASVTHAHGVDVASGCTLGFYEGFQ